MADLVVHLRKPKDWAKPVRIHYWNTWPERHQTTWPGVPMTEEAEGWFVFRFETVSSANLLFTDGRGRQTNDLCATGKDGFGADAGTTRTRIWPTPQHR